jgi:hypothetical protein
MNSADITSRFENALNKAEGALMSRDKTELAYAWNLIVGMTDLDLKLIGSPAVMRRADDMIRSLTNAING